ncbi:MAG: protein kinase [Planctomycetes bacterium]|nr:protein kinase [Planctomycetota bacterium]
MSEELTLTSSSRTRLGTGAGSSSHAAGRAARSGVFWRLWHGASRAHLRCGDCGAALSVAGLASGARARCGKCGSVFTVPGAANGGAADVALNRTKGDGAFEAGGAGTTDGIGQRGASADSAAATRVAKETPALSQSAARHLLDRPPEKVGAYKVESEIARGGTAVVFRGRHETLGKPVAIKLLTPAMGERFSLAAQGEMSRRLFREALTLARFRHPHIVPVLDAGQTEHGIPYLVMEYVDGEDLSRRLKRGGPMEAKQALRILAQVIEGVDFAHAQGVVHRDLKPGNILIDALGDAQLVDFGLARDDAAGSRLTQSGVALGTPSYMPPEQARGEREKIGTRSDIYSLGAILYEMLTGRPPFEGQRVMEVLYKVCHDEPKPPHLLNPKVSCEAEAICIKAMEKDPAKRYASAYQMLQDVRALLKGEPPPVAWSGRGNRLVRFLRRKGLWSWKGAAAGFVLLAVLGSMAERRERSRRVNRLVIDGRTLLAKGDLDASDEKFVEALQLDGENAEAFLARREVKALREEAARKKAEADAQREAELKKLAEILKLDPAKLAPARLKEFLQSTAEKLGAAMTGMIREADPTKAPDKVEAKTADPEREPKAPALVRVTIGSKTPGAAFRIYPAAGAQPATAVFEGATPASTELAPGVYLIKYRKPKSPDAAERDYVFSVSGFGAREQSAVLPE